MATDIIRLESMGVEALAVTQALANGTLNLDFDAAGVGGIELVFNVGTFSAGTTTIAVVESDTGAFAGEEATVPDERLLGGSSAFALGTTDADSVFRMGLIPLRRFIRLILVSAGGGTKYVSVDAVKTHPRHSQAS